MEAALFVRQIKAKILRLKTGYQNPPFLLLPTPLASEAPGKTLRSQRNNRKNTEA